MTLPALLVAGGGLVSLAVWLIVKARSAPPPLVFPTTIPTPMPDRPFVPPPSLPEDAPPSAVDRQVSRSQLPCGGVAPCPTKVPGLTTSENKVARWAAFIEQYRGDLPAALLYGHVLVETGGSACPTATTRGLLKDENRCGDLDPNDCAGLKKYPKCLDERGLFGVDFGTRCTLGIDAAKICDPDYATKMGVREYVYRLSHLDKFQWASTTDKARAAYFSFAIGSGGAAKYLSTKEVNSWQTIAAKVKASGATTAGKAVANNDKMWVAGQKIDQAVRASMYLAGLGGQDPQNIGTMTLMVNPHRPYALRGRQGGFMGGVIAELASA